MPSCRRRPQPRGATRGGFSNVRRKSGRILGLGRSFEGLLSAWGGPEARNPNKMSRLRKARKRAMRVQPRLGAERELFGSVTSRDARYRHALCITREPHSKVFQRQAAALVRLADPSVRMRLRT